jgi:hypothetical protein
MQPSIGAAASGEAADFEFTPDRPTPKGERTGSRADDVVK